VSVEDELNAFYSDMGAVLTSTGKAETKSIFSVSDMVSTSNNQNKSNSSPKKTQDSELSAFYADLETVERKINTTQPTSKINFNVYYFFNLIYIYSVLFRQSSFHQVISF